MSAYHYLSLCRGGVAQAEHFLSVVPDDADLPLVLDVEPDGRCNRGERLGRTATVVQDFLGVVEERRGVRPMVYTSMSFERSHLSGVAGERWLAAYSRRPPDPWTLWQYTDNAVIPGIRGPVDGNVFHGSAREFEGLRDGR